MSTTYNYRNIPFTYREWTTWDDKPASGFTCNDKSLLSYVDTVSFGARDLEEMRENIDYYLDNIEKCKELKKLNTQASAVFYETLNYKGD